MWGNALGWCISLVWAALVGAGVFWLHENMEKTSARTEFSRTGANASEIALPVSPLTVLPAMSEPIDAGAIYRRAIRQYQQDATTYDRFARSGQLRDVEDVPAIWTLVEAIPCSSGNLFGSDPSEIVNYNAERPALEALRSLGACARRAGQLLEAQQPSDAMRLYEAAFALGARLYEERLTYAELDAGLTLLAEGSAMIRLMSEKSGDAARAAACRAFDDARVAYVKQQILPTQRILSTADQTLLEHHAGDVFYFARHAADRMWRVEAIFKLGRYRYNAGRLGDQRIATRVVSELSNDPDPVIRAAAIAARDLTEQQFRMLK